MAIDWKTRSKQPKSRVYELGPDGKRELFSRIKSLVWSHCDPAQLLMIGDDARIGEEGSGRVLKPSFYDEIVQSFLPKSSPSNVYSFDDLDKPLPDEDPEAAAKRKSEEEVKVRERLKGRVLTWHLLGAEKFDVFGEKVPVTFAARKPARKLAEYLNRCAYPKEDKTGGPDGEIDVRMLVLLNPGVEGRKYLGEFVDRLADPIEIYVYEDWLGELARIDGGEGEDLAGEELFLPMRDWPELPKPEPIVAELLLRRCIHVFAGRFESYKTMFAFELAAGVLQRRPVADYFAVLGSDEFLGSLGVLYLGFDMDPGMARDYAADFGLAADPRFHANHPTNCAAPVALDDPRLCEYARGKILIVDTMLDVANIQDAFQSAEWIGFFGKARRLITEFGCEAIVLISHPTKAGAKSAAIDPSDYLKDSVTFGGKIDVGFGFRNIDGTAKVQVERIKGRGFKGKELKFSLAVREDGDPAGSSNLSKGRFPVCDTPDDDVSLKDQLRAAPGALKNLSAEQVEKLRELMLANPPKGLRDAAKEYSERFKLKKAVSKDSVARWWKAIREQDAQGAKQREKEDQQAMF